MADVALLTWILTSAVGARLLYLWLRGHQPKVTRYPRILVIGHPVLAVAGLGSWVAFLATGGYGYAYAAFTTLVVVTLLGCTMFTRWLGRGRHAGGTAHFPKLAVALHGLAGGCTFVLVLLTLTNLRP